MKKKNIGIKTPLLEGHGFCSRVIKMRNEGKSDLDTANYLKSKGLSRLMIGVLISKEEVTLSESGFRVKCDRLLPKK